MTYSPFEAELTRPPYASLRPDDLETMGKHASRMFLEQGTSLNDAVVKVASSHYGITTEQVKRIVEFANQHTFNQLFEKQAGDKNIEFAVADPGSILRNLNDSARGPVVKVAADYSRPPLQKTAQKNIEADLALLGMFGVAPRLTLAMEKVAFGAPMDASAMAPGQGGPMPPPQLPTNDPSQLVAKNPMQGKDLTDPTSFLDEMPASEGALQKGMEYANATMAQARELKDPSSFMKTLDSVKQTAKLMFPQAEEQQQAQGGGAGAMGQPGMGQMPPPPQGIDPSKMAAALIKEALDSMWDSPHTTDAFADMMAPDMMVPTVPTIPPMSDYNPFAAGQGFEPGSMYATTDGDDERDPSTPKIAGAMSLERRESLPKKEFAIAKGKAKKEGVGVEGDAKGAYPIPDKKHAKVALGLVGMHGTPEEKAQVKAKVHAKYPDMGKGKEAMDYLRAGRPDADLILKDLQKYASLENIKQATQGRAQYPEADPYRELRHAVSLLAKEAHDLTYKKDQAEDLQKTALNEFGYQVRQHVLSGGGLGEITHAISGLGSEEQVKTASAFIAEDLSARPRVDMVRLHADMVRYEMEKGASSRMLNPNNPIIQSFNAYVQSGDAARAFGELAKEAASLYTEAVRTLGHTMTRV